jgi:hypothetical protein
MRWREWKAWQLLKEWGGLMSGWLSIPFLLAALIYPNQRLLFGLLGYAAMWGLVISQSRRVSRLEGQRDNEVGDCVDRAAKALQSSLATKSLFSFNAICLADAHKLATNEQLVAVCDELKTHQYDHPFEGLDEFVPKKDWLAFVKAAIRRPDIEATRGGDFIWLAEHWHEVKGYPKPSGTIPLVLKVRQGMFER